MRNNAPKHTYLSPAMSVKSSFFYALVFNVANSIHKMAFHKTLINELQPNPNQSNLTQHIQKRLSLPSIHKSTPMTSILRTILPNTRIRCLKHIQKWNTRCCHDRYQLLVKFLHSCMLCWIFGIDVKRRG